MQRTPQEWARLVLGVGLGLGMLGWFVSGLEWQPLGRALATVRVEWLGAAVVAMMVQYALHAVRWGVLLHHLAPGIGPGVLWSSTAVLWAFNTVMPLRAGNLLRPLVVSRAMRLPYPTVLFATVGEYVCDAFGLIALVLVALFLVPADLAAGPLAGAMGGARWLAIGGAACFFAVVLLSSRGAHQAVSSLLRPIPSARVRARLLTLFEQLVEGMAAVGDPWRLGLGLALTLAVWAAWLVSLMCTLRAFSLAIPLAGALFLETTLNLAMLVPQAPGFLGVFQVVTREALELWHAPGPVADAVALVFWLVCFGPITVIGLFEAARTGATAPPEAETPAT